MIPTLSEKQIQVVFETFPEQLLEEGMEFITRPKSEINELRINLLFRDKNGKEVAFALRKETISRNDVGPMRRYARMYKGSRLIVAVPHIDLSIKNTFERFGIEYLEFDINEILKLYTPTNSGSSNEEIPTSKSENDGNIAFKVTYTDSNWTGVCSPVVAAHNFRNRTWCGIQEHFDLNCQSEEYSDANNLTNEFAPCQDSIAQKELVFYAGHFHGEKHDNEPKTCLYAKLGKIAIFTSRRIDEPEDERFIFAIGQMNNFETVNDRRGDYELYHCDKETAIIFNTSRPKYWKYYSNRNNPDREAWNTGLFRYLDNEVVSEILTDIIGSNRHPNKVKEKARFLLGEVKGC